jgi:hypothetical protein
MVWVGVAIGGLALLVVVMLLVGRSLPPDHVASRMSRFARPPERVWRELTDIDAFAQWRTGVKKVERVPGKTTKWIEHGPHGPLTLETVESDAPRRLVNRIADPSLPFGGGWTFELERYNEGCTLTISETGVVKPALFRFLSKYVFGHSAELDKYLRDLARRLEDAATPMPARAARPAPLKQVYPS